MLDGQNLPVFRKWSMEKITLDIAFGKMRASLIKV